MLPSMTHLIIAEKNAHNQIKIFLTHTELPEGFAASSTEDHNQKEHLSFLVLRQKNPSPCIQALSNQEPANKEIK